MKIELYIDGTLVDIDNNTTMPITFQATDLSNPTAVENSWSKTVSLPATQVNNDLFNHIWRLDHQILNFNPSKRVPFVLSGDGAIVEQGYIKMNSIDYSGRLPKSYNITLYGGVGDFFYSLSEKDMADLSLNYDHNINRDKIIQTWDSYTQGSEDLPPYSYALTYSGLYDNFDSQKVYNEFVDTQLSGFILDTIEVDGTFYNLIAGGILTFTPGNKNGSSINTGLSIPNQIRWDSNENRFLLFNTYQGYVWYSNGSDLTTWERVTVSNGQVRDLIVTSFSDSKYRYMFLQNTGGLFYGSSLDEMSATKNKSNFWQLNDIAPYGAGLLGYKEGRTNWNYEVMAYGLEASGFDRSYMYRIDPDGQVAVSSLRWITSIKVKAAAYAYYPLVYGSDNTLNYWDYANTEAGWQGVQHYGLGNVVDMVSGDYVASDSYPYEAYAISDTNHKIRIRVRPGEAPVSVSMSQPSLGSMYATIAYSDQDKMLQIGTTPYTSQGGGAVLSYGPARQNDYNNWETITGFYEPIDTEENDYNEYQRNEYRSYYQRPMLRVRNLIEQILTESGYTYTLDAGFFNKSNHYWNETYIIMDRLKVADEQIQDNKVGNIRSGDAVTYGMMIGQGTSQYDFFISYCMMFGILVIMNKNDKSIRLVQRKDYFSEYEVLEWSEKIDYQKSTRLEVLTFNFKTGVLRYEGAGSKYEERYEESNNIPYGSLNFETGYEFNNDEKVFLETVFQNTVYSREYDPTFNGRYKDQAGKTIDAYADDKILPALFTTSGDQMSYNESSYHLVFWSGMQELRTAISLSDDNPRMLDISLFMWTDASNDVTIKNKIPNITALFPSGSSSVNSLYFSRPGKQYYTGGVTYPDGISIYDIYHEGYYKELYNNNNKILTAYFYLDSVDINQFAFNQFITIGDSLWFINKITDYDLTNEASAKVELIRVSDIKGYTGDK